MPGTEPSRHSIQFTGWLGIFAPETPRDIVIQSAGHGEGVATPSAALARLGWAGRQRAPNNSRQIRCRPRHVQSNPCGVPLQGGNQSSPERFVQHSRKPHQPSDRISITGAALMKPHLSRDHFHDLAQAGSRRHGADRRCLAIRWLASINRRAFFPGVPVSVGDRRRSDRASPPRSKVTSLRTSDVPIACRLRCREAGSRVPEERHCPVSAAVAIGVQRLMDVTDNVTARPRCAARALRSLPRISI
jgi:hypothetical protein